MDKTYIISFGYHRFATTSKELALELLNITEVEREYLEGEYVYTPKAPKGVTVELIDSSLVRPLTIEEVENKELASAKASASWAKDQAEKFRKEIEELKCQLKVALSKPEVPND